jgi:hypothetical protein
MTSYEHALQRLYQVPIADFLVERKRLAAELRAEGDEVGAAQIAKRPKPLTSVWAVNHLYWHARDAFDEMLATAARLRAGDVRAAKAHYDAIASLRKRAASILTDAGHAASDATLRRIATTLAAIAAAGGFEPDPAGALAADRDPPGFDALNVPTQPTTGTPQGAAAEARARAVEEAKERKRREAERARWHAQRSRLETALRAARSEVGSHERERAALEKQLHAADAALGKSREMVKDLERQLAELGTAD